MLPLIHTTLFCVKWMVFSFTDTALRHGFSYFERIGGMRFIERHTYELTHTLVTAMVQLTHNNRKVDTDTTEVSLCTIYGRHFESTVSSKTQGTPLILPFLLLHFGIYPQSLIFPRACDNVFSALGGWLPDRLLGSRKTRC